MLGEDIRDIVISLYPMLAFNSFLQLTITLCVNLISRLVCLFRQYFRLDYTTGLFLSRDSFILKASIKTLLYDA
jgi:hypothetical protein